MGMEIGNVNQNYAGHVKGFGGVEDVKVNDAKLDNSSSQAAEKSEAARSTADYYSELQKKYNWMKGGDVSISGKYLKQCAGDAKKAKELEDFLQKIPELEKQGYERLSAQNAAKGGKVTFYQQTWMINDDGSVQSSVYSVTETEMTNAERMKKNMDERLEKQKEKKEEEEKAEKKKEEKAEQQDRMKKTSESEDNKNHRVSVKYVEAETEDEALELIHQEKREGAYYPKVDVSL